MLTCDMEKDCEEPVSHIDSKGFVYCAKHGERRKMDVACRKLQSGEIKKLESGQAIAYRRPRGVAPC